MLRRTWKFTYTLVLICLIFLAAFTIASAIEWTIFDVLCSGRCWEDPYLD